VSARDDDVFAEADRFIPERWLRADCAVDSATNGLSDDARQRHAFSCLPFGYGNRSCLGQFAMTSPTTLLLLSANFLSSTIFQRALQALF